ncbi:MAG: BlaI/MecI/CopY family transcriptional regulator [Truepera sp.]|nr:BlaI/MecI/CopY family transcriptional regulator [Truepera sp.]
MSNPTHPQPTDRELSILQILWELGPSTVRAVNRELNRREGRDIAYTSVLTVLQIMTEKGLAARNDSQKTHVYQAAVPQQVIERALTDQLIDKLFQGSALRLVLNAVRPERLSEEERAELRALLDQVNRE